MVYDSINTLRNMHYLNSKERATNTCQVHAVSHLLKKEKVPFKIKKLKTTGEKQFQMDDC